MGSARVVVRRFAVPAIRLLARQRHRLPAWADEALMWVRWRMPDSWVRALTGRTAIAGDSHLPDGWAFPDPPGTQTRLLIGPANFAGQGYAWARAVETNLEDVGATNFALEVPGGFAFPHDYGVAPAVYRRNHPWQHDQFEFVARGYTHVLIEAGRSLSADVHHYNAFREAEAFRKRGLSVAMMSHGSDTRNPARHAAKYAWSPYRDPSWHDVPRLQHQAELLAGRLKHFDGPVFVSTPDLIDDLPFATWCPVVVDVDRWATDEAATVHDRPVVVHAPSDSRIKGTSAVDRALRPLDAEGVIAYHRPERVPSADMPALYQGADIVLDQFRLGSYGVAACEAMAAGRVVVGNITEVNRERVRRATGLDLPIVQAEPDQIGAVVRGLIGEPDRVRDIAAAGPRFVRAVHSGSYSAGVLGAFLRSRHG